MTRKIKHDIIARVTHPDWAVRKARLLISDTGEAAVFTRKGAPDHVMRFDELNVHKGSMTLAAEGDENPVTVTFRRVGSSCSWALAKCQVASLASFWPEDEE